MNIHTEGFPDGAVRGQLRVFAAPSGDCEIAVEPSTVAVGQDFVVSGNFGGAEIHLVKGENTPLPEDSEPVATIPEDESSFSVSFTAEAGDEGTWTVWAFIPATECGDSALLTVGQLPDAAAQPIRSPLAEVVGGLFLVLALLSVHRFGPSRVRK